MTEYKKTDDYEGKAATFQIVMLHQLNEALRDAGIADQAKRREICENFGFAFGVLSDQSWFKDADGTKVYPCIAFSTRGPASEVDPEDLGTVFLPSSMFAFHEYLHGNAAELFEEMQEDLSVVEMGNADS